MWLGYFGLTIAFVCLISIALWILIHSTAHAAIKIILIVFAIWYGLALYYTAPNFMGWPTIQSIPDGSWVLSVRIQEPGKNSSGAIYFWLNTRPVERKITLADLLDPRKTFLYYSEVEPRAYKLFYDRELHKRIMKVLKKKGKTPGGRMIIGRKGRKKGKGKKGLYLDDQIKFKIINPIDLLSKE